MNINTKETKAPFLILILSICIFSICVISIFLKVPPRQPISRKVIMKHDSIELQTRFDAFNGKFLQYPVTVYYLIADSGHATEVGLSTYATIQVGQEYATSDWQIK
jgi:hypothetical protein